MKKMAVRKARRNPLLARLKVVLIALGIALVYGVVSEMDYQDLVLSGKKVEVKG